MMIALRRIILVDLKGCVYEWASDMSLFTEHVEAEESYTAALKVCPVCYSKERSILFSNRAAARLHQVSFGCFVQI